ncbi:MAG: hypothetical protein QM528_07180 [Phycisphaerales bacterium]|nr:hypothetical protein [Phycisphaerales bacterium]
MKVHCWTLIRQYQLNARYASPYENRGMTKLSMGDLKGAERDI